MAERIRYEEAVAKYEPLSDYERGLVEGIYRYAWMRDGVFYVGTTGATLGEAVDRALAEAREKRLRLIGYDFMLIDGLAKRLHRACRPEYEHSPIRNTDAGRGRYFEVRFPEDLPGQRIGRITVELDRVEQSGAGE